MPHIPLKRVSLLVNCFVVSTLPFRARGIPERSQGRMSLGLLRFTIIESSLDLSAHFASSLRSYAYPPPSPSRRSISMIKVRYTARIAKHGNLNIPVMDGAKYARQKEPSPGIEEYVLLGFYFVARDPLRTYASHLTPAYTHLVFQLSIHVSSIPFLLSLFLSLLRRRPFVPWRPSRREVTLTNFAGLQNRHPLRADNAPARRQRGRRQER